MNRKTLMALIYGGVISLIIMASLLLMYFPMFATSLLSLVSVVIGFVLTENMWTHDAAEFENRFWTMISFWTAWTVIFVSDSPFNYYVALPYFPSFECNYTLKFFTCMIIAYVAHNYDRHLRRLVLMRVPNIKKIRSTAFADEHRLGAKQKVSDLREQIKVIDSPWMSSAMQTLFMWPQLLFAESQIIMLLEEASTDELNMILTTVELGLIFYKMKDHTYTRQMNRSKLLRLLCVDRISELNVPARAMLLDGLQRMKISSHRESETHIKNIIMKTKEDKLSELKSLTDSKGDFHSMHRLLYVDIRNKSIKRELLTYIKVQARVQAAYNKIGSRRGRSRNQQQAWRKILSDVDDTLVCSFGSFPAGVDTSFPKGVLYPGVLAFYRELDIGTSGDEHWDDSRVGNLVFLSARPHVYKDISEHYSYEKFRGLQDTRGLYTSPTLLAGNLDSGSQFMLGGSMEPLAVKKFENFSEYVDLYPEYQCIFVGDNGQGDVRCAEMVMDSSEYSENLERVYIHQVQDLTDTHAVKSITKTRLCPKTCYFTSYIDAGIDAYHHKLIRPSGLRRLAVEAIRDFEKIPKATWSSAAAKRVDNCSKELRQMELNSALIRANKLFLAEGLESIGLTLFEQLYSRGTAILTMYGGGIINGFNKHTGLYEVLIQMGHMYAPVGVINNSGNTSNSITNTNNNSNRHDINDDVGHVHKTDSLNINGDNSNGDSSNSSSSNSGRSSSSNHANQAIHDNRINNSSDIGASSSSNKNDSSIDMDQNIQRTSSLDQIQIQTQTTTTSFSTHIPSNKVNLSRAFLRADSIFVLSPPGGGVVTGGGLHRIPCLPSANTTGDYPYPSPVPAAITSSSSSRNRFSTTSLSKSLSSSSASANRYKNPFKSVGNSRGRRRGSSFGSSSSFHDLHEGAVTWTPYGLARIMSQRRSDSMVVLEALYYKATFYLKPCDIVQLFPPSIKNKEM